MPESAPRKFENSQPSRLDELLALLVNGSIEKDQFAELETLLLDNPDAQKRYLHTLDLHAALLKQAKLEAPVIADDKPAKSAEIKKSAEITDNSETHATTLASGFPAATLIAAGIMLAMGILIGQLLQGTPSPDRNEILPVTQVETSTDDGVALLRSSLDLVWDQASAVKTIQDGILSPGRVAFDAGIAQIEMYSGARLIAEGPAAFHLHSMNDVTFEYGKIRVILPPHAMDISLKTNHFQLIANPDKGAELGLYLDKQGELQLENYQGAITIMKASGEGEKILLSAGKGIQLQTDGTHKAIPIDQTHHADSDLVDQRKRVRDQHRYDAWQKWQTELRKDKRLRVLYDFEAEDGGHYLINRQAPNEQNATRTMGAIIGAEWTHGRWDEKMALAFNRSSDRVRLNLPGTYEAMTLCTWVRVDALPDRNQALLLTDNYKVGHVHWQINQKGSLRLGVRIPSKDWKTGATGYGTPPLFTPKTLGKWCFLATVYDLRLGQVRHYFNGRKVSQDKIIFKQPLQIGHCDIGNWGVQAKAIDRRNYVRNFVGRMDEFMIWDAVLPGGKIQQLYREGRPSVSSVSKMR